MSLEVVQDDETPEGCLKAMLARCQDFDGVIVIGLNKDGGQHLATSRMSMMEKAFLVAFADSWIKNWFDPEHHR